MNRNINHTIFYFFLIALVVFIPVEGFSEPIRGQDKVLREVSTQQNPTINFNQNIEMGKTSISQGGPTVTSDEIIVQCESQYRNYTRKAVECILRNSNIIIDITILQNCTKPWGGDLKEALTCYNTQAGLIKNDLNDAKISFGDKSLALVQEGLKVCLEKHRYDSSGYHNCFEYWNRKKDEMWNDYQTTRINFRNESLGLVQEGVKACLVEKLLDGASGYRICFEYWNIRKDEAWNDYQIELIK